MLHQYTELKNARYMGFSFYPASNVALAICRMTVEKINHHEKRSRARKAKDKANFGSAVSLIIGDLLIAATSEGGGWAYRSVSKKSFSGSFLKGDTFNSIIRSLEELGLIESVRGGNLKNPFAAARASEFRPGMATRFRITTGFIDLCASCGLTLSVAQSHFKRRPSLQEVRLKGKSSRFQGQKATGRSIRFDETDQTRSIKHRLYEANAFLLTQDYQGMEFFGLRRIFNEGDDPTFDWNLGGRLYGVGDESYQMFKKAKRAEIKINGERVVELDINASYLRILHSLRGFELPKSRDIYSIRGIDRKIVKAWIAATLGHSGFHRAWPSKLSAELRKSGIPLSKDISYPSLTPKVLARFPVLNDWPDCGIRWSHLMYEEAEAMMTAMETLRYEGVPALPVHDSLIVPKSKKRLAHDILKETFETRFSVPFVVKAS